MRQTTQITIEHMVVTPDHSYDHVIEAQLGQRAGWENMPRELITTHATFEQAVQLVEQQLETSGFTILSKIEPGALLALSGKPTRVTQYALGNPKLSIQIIEHAPEAALYAPLRLVVYENRAGKAVVAYERFTSQLAQYPYPEVAAVAQLVEHKLDELVAIVTGNVQETHADKATVGHLIRYEAKPGKEADVERDLKAALARIQEEPATIVWFAIRLGPSTFGVFDAYSDEEGRQMRLAVGGTLLAEKASELFAQPPLIEQVDILAAKLTSQMPRAEDNISP